MIKSKGILTYFAVRAPREPQPWFRPKMETERPQNRWVSLDEEKEYPSVDAAKRDTRGFINANETVQQEWDEEYRKQHCVQWPFAWARAVLGREDEK